MSTFCSAFTLTRLDSLGLTHIQLVQFRAGKALPFLTFFFYSLQTLVLFALSIWMCNDEVLGVCVLSFPKLVQILGKSLWPNFLQHGGTHFLPETFCVKGKKCHEVIQEKGRMIQHMPLLAEQTSTMATEIRATSSPSATPQQIQLPEINLTWTLSFCHDLQSQKFSVDPKGHLVILAEQRADNRDGNEEKLGKNILPPCFFQRKRLRFPQNCSLISVNSSVLLQSPVIAFYYSCPHKAGLCRREIMQIKSFLIITVFKGGQQKVALKKIDW